MGDGPLKRAREAGLWRRVFASRLNVLAAVVVALVVGAAAGAPWIAPHRPFDLMTLNLADGLRPPVWSEEGMAGYWLGTDDQGRDVLSAILFGMRASLAIGLACVVLSVGLGSALGLIAGYWGGWLDRITMRLADIQLSFPPMLTALTLDGVGRVILPRSFHEVGIYGVLIGALVLAGWPQYARVVRGLTLVEKNKEYVLAAHLVGASTWYVLSAHVLPNVMRPVWVLAAMHLATAILTESTLSFLGVGVPPTSPSLGSLIHNGNNFIFSGQWWIVAFPGLALVMLIAGFNLLGDGLQEALHPRRK